MLIVGFSLVECAVYVPRKIGKNEVFCCVSNFWVMQREEVIQAWYMDDSDEDQRLPHHREPKEFVSLDQLAGKHLR